MIHPYISAMIINLKERANQLNKDIPAIFLALTCEQTPILAKVLAGITIAYALSPIDLIPDFIPVVGCLDDIIILPALTALVIRLIPPNVFRKCQLDAQIYWKNGIPKHWFFAIPIVCFWLWICYSVLNAILTP